MESLEVEDDDDGVIFEGSPLYESLMNSGVSTAEFEVENVADEKCMEIAEQSRETDQEKRTSVYRDKLLLMISVIWNYLVHIDFTDVAQENTGKVLETLRHATTLDDDDSDFLARYLDSTTIQETAPHKTQYVPNIVYMSLIPCICGYGYHRMFSPELPWQHILLTDIIGTLLLVILAAKGLKLIFKIIYRKEKNLEQEYIAHFLKKDEQLLSTLKKSIRLVQETELIARGFTLISQKNPLSRLEGQSSVDQSRQCPALRKLIFLTTREIIHFFRRITKSLLENNKLGEDIDFKVGYLAYESIQSYGPCLRVDIEEGEGDTDLYGLTDGFSISALKGIVQLFSLHQSEFIKALTLIYHHGNTQEGITEYTRTVTLVKDETSRLEGWTTSVQKSYDYHKCSLFTRDPVIKKGQGHTQMEDINTAVHSLDLHLQAALTRVRSLGVFLEKHSKEYNLKSHNKSHDLIQMMQPIRAELDSCKGCWEEGVTRIEKLFQKESKQEMVDTKSGTDVDNVNTDVETNLPELVLDYIIQDQVFEGYTDPTAVCNDASEWDEMLTSEEKAKKKREKEEALRMLSELKSVISIRAVDTQKRELAALLRTNPELQQTLTNKIKPNESHDIKTSNQLAENDQNCADIHTVRSISNDNLTTEGEQCINAEVIKDNLPEENTENDEKKNSIITYQGVRRLRKSNMLDLSDSDSEEETSFKRHRENIANVPDDNHEDDKIIANNFEKLCLPPLPLNKGFEIESDGCLDSDDDDIAQTKQSARTLHERIGLITGANLGFAGNIAALAVARSHEMGDLKETTFGGEVFGELSDSDTESVKP